MMKKLKGCLTFLLVALLILASTLSVNATVNLVYSNGKVNDIREDKIIVSGRTYELDPKVRVLIHTKKNNAFYERFGSRQDVHTGASVYIRTIGNSNKIVEIIVERWKQ